MNIKAGQYYLGISSVTTKPTLRKIISLHSVGTRIGEYYVSYILYQVDQVPLPRHKLLRTLAQFIRNDESRLISKDQAKCLLNCAFRSHK